MTFIIAEIAQAHDGSLGIAHSYIDLATEVGADAVKFQTHIADEESTADEPWRVKFSYKDETRFEYWKRLEFSLDEWISLRKHAKDVGLKFISSPFSLPAVDILERVQVDAIKIASGEVTNCLLLEKISKVGSMIYLSSGMSSYSEIDKALDIVGRTNTTLLQCTSSYPVLPSESGLNIISEMRKLYPDLSIGLSDHSGEIYASLAAIALGATSLELHLTFDKNLFGPDSSSSLNPNQFKEVVSASKWLDVAFASPLDKNQVVFQKESMRRIFMKSFYAATDLPAGSVINLEDVKLLKPLKGIPASCPGKVIGRKLKKSVQACSPLQESDFYDN